MVNPSFQDQKEPGDLISRMDSLDQRLSRIEELLDYRYKTNLSNRNQQEISEAAAPPKVESEVIESRFGEQLFAWISGIVVLFLVVFLMAFFQNQGQEGLAVLVGYGVTLGVILLSYFLRTSFPNQVFLLRVTGHVLLYYVTLRLHFFNENPVLSNEWLSLSLLLIPIAYLLYFSIRRSSEVLTILGVFFIIATGVISDQSFVMLPLLSLTAAFSLYFHWQKSWNKLLHFSLFAVYFTHLMWLMNNPLMEHSLGAIAEAQGNLIFLFSYGFIFSMVALVKPKEGFKQGLVTSVTIWSGLLFALVLMLDVSIFYKESYSGIFAAITIFSLAYSMILKLRESHFFITTFYACVSFIALSVMVYGLVGLPAAYLWLVLQSLLVVSIALWFRTPLIVIVNTLLFVGLFIFYLIQSEPVNSTNLAFALVAGVSARFINWQRERLNLKTEGIRNTYLVATFFTVLFALYHLVPPKFITLSWAGAAGLFFVLSFWLKNKKYRWMAFATLITAVVYLFFFDLKSMELGYRVVAFLIIGVVTLATSFYYARKSRK